MDANRSYSEIYLHTCDLLRETAERTLERLLTPQELAHIYNAGSLMMLELVGVGIEAGSKESILETLLSVDYLDRLDETKQQLPKILEKEFLGQALSQQLVEKLRQIPYVYTAYQIVLRMEQTPQEARYEQLIQIVDDLIQN
ncbi:MAG: hypothetical protein KF726_08350 [Anaerolineae bacterium]|nr:hypothetical protein [Anaerolineae bacterium]